MRTTSLLASSMLLIALLTFSFQIVLAHETITVGDYEVEIGWMAEPPVVGQQNGVVVNVSNTTNEEAVVDISNLTVSLSYGGQTKELTLEPAGEETADEYVAAVLPTVAGEYTVQLRGQLDTTEISEDVNPEEVVPADTLEFPSAAATATQQSTGLAWSDWLSIIGVLSGLAGLILALVAMRRPRA